MHGVLDHARRNGVAWVALFVALGGSSVAAVSLANHSIDPVKLNPNSIGGYTRAWVSVTATGRITVSTAKVRVVADAFDSKGRGEQSIVQTYNSQGQAAALPYDMDLVCSTPR